MKNNKLLIILIIIIIGLSAYIVYDSHIEEKTLVDVVVHECRDSLLDKEKLEDYKNSDGTYGIQKSLSDTNYSTQLSLDGKVKVCYQENCHEITNINNVIDMLKWTVSGDSDSQKVLFLLNNGDLYSYTYKNYNSSNFEAEKIEDISKVSKIVEFSYSGNNKDTNWGVIAITEDNLYVEVYKEGI